MIKFVMIIRVIWLIMIGMMNLMCWNLGGVMFILVVLIKISRRRFRVEMMYGWLRENSSCVMMRWKWLVELYGFMNRVRVWVELKMNIVVSKFDFKVVILVLLRCIFSSLSRGINVMIVKIVVKLYVCNG